MSIRNDIPPDDPKFHELGSHCVVETLRPSHERFNGREEPQVIVTSSLWNCIRRIRELETGMTRSHEHSPYTIIKNKEKKPYNIYKK